MRSLLSITATNFLSLQKVSVDLGDLTVLVGPNGAGKSNFLRVIQFLGETARLDLVPAIGLYGGFNRLLFRGIEEDKRSRARVTLGVTGVITGNASLNAPDEYSLDFWQSPATLRDDNVNIVRRKEVFVFKRTQGRGRRITVSGTKVELVDGKRVAQPAPKQISASSSGLSTLPRLGKDDGGKQIGLMADLFTSFRVFDVNVARARRPSQFVEDSVTRLDSDARNLAAFLYWLRKNHPDTFNLLEEDLISIVPSIKSIKFRRLSGSDDSSYSIHLTESHLHGTTSLSEASFGTIRALALLAMLHDPNPPKLTCVEEIDHGLHPHALDRIVERMRDASARTQLLVVTHSPALANRLKPQEMVVCERDENTGGSAIPAIQPSKVAEMARTSGLLPGELWFSGALGGSL